ncbi:MAG: metalloregulator ArsR/SmtB family transcription factor [Planctomycetota bacterium]
MTDIQKLTRIFGALSVDTRLRIIELLRDRTLCVGALSAMLDVTQGAVSQHLRILRDADLVAPEKQGYYVHYRINEKTLDKWQKHIGKFLGTRKKKRSCPWKRKGRR